MRRKRKKHVVPVQHGLPVYPRGSPEAVAVRVLHEIVGRMAAFYTIFRRGDGSVSYVKPVTEQFAALAKAPASSDWVTLTYRQAGSWEDFIEKYVNEGIARQHLREGSIAPWPWPPSIEGKLYPAGSDPPLMTEQDYQEDMK